MQAVVIGQGAAGLTAALVLAREGIKVPSVSKTRPGNATCTIYAGGGFTLGAQGVSTEKHRQMTWDTGRHLNVPGLLDVFSQEAPSIIPFMESAGVPFNVRRGGLSIRKDPAFPLLGGKPLIEALYRACIDLDVTFLSNAVVMRLLTDDKGVSGIEWLDYHTGRVSELAARSVILATGGGGAVYERTDNPQRITGDGYRLALEAGCNLLDMEFVQFYPIGIDIPGGAHWFMDLGIIDSARLTNCHGREFLKEMLLEEGISSGREANLLARDKCSVAIALENLRGQVLLHLEDIPEQDWKTDEYLGSIARMFPQGRPPWTGPVPVQPIEHYFPGGVAIGPDGETEISGLFACGEVTGGVDGANRVGGNALTNCILFGQRAGKAAAAHAKGDIHPPLTPDRLTYVPPAPSRQSSQGPAQESRCQPSYQVTYRSHQPASHEIMLPCRRWSAQNWLSSWLSAHKESVPGAISSQADTVTPRDLRRSIRAHSSHYLQPIRNGDDLAEALRNLEVLGNLLPRQTASTSMDLLLSAENLGLWYTLVTVTGSAYMRTESRGAHFRTDFPEEDPEWARHVCVRMGEGSLRVFCLPGRSADMRPD